jgi:hypothetical protein
MLRTMLRLPMSYTPARVTVGMWRQRFVDLGIECLEEAP